MLETTEELPLNFGFLGKGNDSLEPSLLEQIAADACGLKLHKDGGTTPATIDAALRVADKTDTQDAIHTDTLNECGFVDDTIDAIAGRIIPPTTLKAPRARRARARYPENSRRKEHPAA
jgi:urease subunit alpha